LEKYFGWEKTHVKVEGPVPKKNRKKCEAEEIKTTVFENEPRGGGGKDHTLGTPRRILVWGLTKKYTIYLST